MQEHIGSIAGLRQARWRFPWRALNPLSLTSCENRDADPATLIVATMNSELFVSRAKVAPDRASTRLVKGSKEQLPDDCRQDANSARELRMPGIDEADQHRNDAGERQPLILSGETSLSV